LPYNTSHTEKEKGMATMWSNRYPGQVASVVNEDPDHITGVVVVDPSLSPDWVRIPGEAPEGMRYADARVEKSVWFSQAPVPQDDGNVEFIDRRTRWHLVRPDRGWHKEWPLALAEVSGVGWILLDLGEELVNLLMEKGEP
jgi:hypothetical protein